MNSPHLLLVCLLCALAGATGGAISGLAITLLQHYRAPAEYPSADTSLMLALATVGLVIGLIEGLTIGVASTIRKR